MRGVKLFQCTDFPPCDKNFSQKENFVAHLKLHEISESALLSCPIGGCTSTFTSHKHVQRHLKECHYREGKLKCPFCDDRFSMKKHLRVHTLEAHDTHDLRCEHESCNCRRIFRTPSKLAEHLQPRVLDRSTNSVAEAPTPKQRPVRLAPPPSNPMIVYRCMEEGCGKQYTEKRNLLAHRRAVHTFQQNFICPETHCKKSFAYKHVLRRHLQRVHGILHHDNGIGIKKRRRISSELSSEGGDTSSEDYQKVGDSEVGTHHPPTLRSIPV